jgi:hypothetical protein
MSDSDDKARKAKQDREDKIQATMRACNPPGYLSNSISSRIARAQAERYVDRATGYGSYDVVKREYK